MNESPVRQTTALAFFLLIGLLGRVSYGQDSSPDTNKKKVVERARQAHAKLSGYKMDWNLSFDMSFISLEMKGKSKVHPPSGTSFSKVEIPSLQYKSSIYRKDDHAVYSVSRNGENAPWKAANGRYDDLLEYGPETFLSFLQDSGVDYSIRRNDQHLILHFDANQKLYHTYLRTLLPEKGRFKKLKEVLSLEKGTTEIWIDRSSKHISRVTYEIKMMADTRSFYQRQSEDAPKPPKQIPAVLKATFQYSDHGNVDKIEFPDPVVNVLKKQSEKLKKSLEDTW